uniref:Putative secreted protein n=1 Tax=Ixodes ricinus TaxID=34613 RepID=A0A6B0TYX5_IXORI
MKTPGAFLRPTMLSPRPRPAFLCSSTVSTSCWGSSSRKTSMRTTEDVCRRAPIAASWLASRRSSPFTSRIWSPGLRRPSRAAAPSG